MFEVVNCAEVVLSMGVRRGFSSWREMSTFCLFFSDCWRCNANGRTQKENVQCYGNSCKQCFPCEKTLHWANVCFSEHGYFNDWVSRVLKELQTVRIFRLSAKSYENANKVPFNSNSFSLFSCFSNVLECWKLREMIFCANGLVVLRMRKWSGGTAHARTFRRSTGCKKCALLAAMLLLHPGFFIHSISQGWANLFNGRVICRKPKTPASRKTN